MTRTTRKGNALDARVSANITSQDLSNKDIQQRGERTTLSNTTGKREVLKSVNIDEDSALMVSIEKLHPATKRGAEAHGG